VELLSAIGLIFGLSDTILGLTVLAWGNSAGDLVANTAVARDGFPIMAYAAVYSGPLFNACIGLGLSLTVKGFVPSFRLHASLSLPTFEVYFFFLLLLLWNFALCSVNGRPIRHCRRFEAYPHVVRVFDHSSY
jgi:sodium/potassium/calcium exchanger 6